MGRIKEYAAFLKEFPRSFETTGALAPSSLGLARELSKCLQDRQTPCRILEVGPGTGAVTSELVRHVSPGDDIELVELNERFVEILQRRFENEQHFRDVRDQVKIWTKGVEELSLEKPFDIIICGLPFNGFPTALVKRIFRHMIKLVRPGGELTFFEYLWIRRVKSLAASRFERKRLEGVGLILERHLAKYEFSREIVWTNVPPAVVHRLRIPSPHDSSDSKAPTKYKRTIKRRSARSRR